VSFIALFLRVNPKRRFTLAFAGGRAKQHGPPNRCDYSHQKSRRFSAPTPEGLRADESLPWQKIQACAAGQRHEFRIKTLGPVLWRKAGASKPVRIIVIAPLG
jgi:hypothetical protein